MQSQRSLLLLIALCFALAVVSLAAAGQPEKKGSNKTVTGCLQKSDEAGEYRLTSTDGKLYDLRSSSVKLGEHVGHQVTVTGSFKAESSNKEEKEENEKAEARESGQKEAGDIQVHTLKMVNSSCK